jgi:integrase
VRLFFIEGMPMPRTAGPYRVHRRRDTQKFIVTIHPASGLPVHVCEQWQRSSFANLPPSLAHLRDPKTKPAAISAAHVLIEFLKKQDLPPPTPVHVDDTTVGEWLVRFTSLNDNPRAARLIGEGSPYSPGTIELYRQSFEHHIRGDPFCGLKMSEINPAHALSFIARIGNHDTKDKRKIAGTRAFEIVINFVRMAFREYWLENLDWNNPFTLKAPKKKKGKRRDVLGEDEIIKLFYPGVITDPLEWAVAVAMFWTGLRRSEIWGLKVEDLDWQTPRLNICHAWKRIASKQHRAIGDPKWHKIRDAPFPEDLQMAIKELWAANGVHNFVFCRKDGTQPGPDWIRDHLPKWMARAKIDPAGRRVVPHSARHSLASILEAKGVPLRYIQDMLGHSRMETTLGYLHTPEGTINEITKKIGRVSDKEAINEKTLDNVTAFQAG